MSTPTNAPLRQGNLQAVQSLTTPGARGTTAGGTGNSELTALRSAQAWQSRAALLRRIQLLSPTVATAVGV